MTRAGKLGGVPPHPLDPAGATELSVCDVWHYVHVSMTTPDSASLCRCVSVNDTLVRDSALSQIRATASVVVPENYSSQRAANPLGSSF